MNRQRVWVGIAGVLAVLLTGSGEVLAHSIGVEVRLDAGAVRVEAYFDDDFPAASVRVVVRDAAGAELAAGETDDDGRWEFPVPPPGRYEVIVDGGDGHRARTSIQVEGDGPVAEPRQISDGPSRTEFTSVPWGRVALGLGLFALLGLIGWAIRRPAPDRAG